MITISRAIGTKIDKNFLLQLAQEGIIYDTKRIWITASGNGVRTPRFACGVSKQFSRGQLIKTKNRLVAISSGYKIIDIPLKHPLYKELIIDRTDPKRFTISFDLSKFPTGYKGQVKLSFHINPKKVLI